MRERHSKVSRCEATRRCQSGTTLAEFETTAADGNQIAVQQLSFGPGPREISVLVGWPDFTLQIRAIATEAENGDTATTVIDLPVTITDTASVDGRNTMFIK